MWELGAARHSHSRACGFGTALEPEQLPGDVEAGGPQMRVRVQQTSAGGRPLRNSEHRGSLSGESFLTSSAGGSRDSFDCTCWKNFLPLPGAWVPLLSSPFTGARALSPVMVMCPVSPSPFRNCTGLLTGVWVFLSPILMAWTMPAALAPS